MILRAEQLVKVYRTAASEVIALQGLDLTIESGELVGIIGASGSGKSTLLSIVSGLLEPTGGRIVFDGLDLGAASRTQLDRYRRDQVGFLWQDSGRNLIPYLSAQENVAMRMPGRAKSSAANELLGRVGLGDRLTHKPHQLSGGEQQRVALAVALANEPQLLLADEPTGELDQATTEAMFALMRDVGETTGLTQIIVSHDPELARHVDRVVRLRDGRVVSEQRMVGTDGEIIEVTMLDDAGRLQLTNEQRELVGDTGRVQVDIDGDELRIRPAT
jgi:ABC-type lipoprotein export system ATPase subunit